MLFIALLACQSPLDCAAAFTLGDDGMCYGDAPVDTGEADTGTGEDEPPTVDDLLDTLPACEPLTGDGRLDLYAGCADGACAGMTYVEMVDAIGNDGSCAPQYFEFDGYTSSSASCDWNNGVSATFSDDDRDGVPDDFDTAYSVYVTSAYDGTTEDGLGIGASMSCFIDGIGVPDEVGFSLVDTDWVLSYAYWSAGGVSLSDNYDRRGNYAPDGLADSLSLYGSTEEF
ncbi:MAG: hypothetical protein Q8P41_19790 [Pseudomonadota bacterium]|nr:hypothetical protein [Pseudomonadota bacterium]